MLTRILHARRAAGPHFADDRGVALLELTIIAPFYLILLVCVFDVSRILIHHMILTEMAHEGARLLSGIPFLETGVYRWDQSTDVYTCVATNTDCTNSMIGHIDDGLKNIVNGLFKFQESNLSLKSGTVRITSEFYNNVDPDWVRVRIRGRYDGFFKLFDNLRFDVRAKGPYV